MLFIELITPYHSYNFLNRNFLRPTIFDKLNKTLWIWLTLEKVNKMPYQHRTSSTILPKIKTMTEPNYWLMNYVPVVIAKDYKNL